MEKQRIEGITASSLTFEGLEPFLRGKTREFLQALLEEEVTEFLGRKKSEHRPVPEQSLKAPELMKDVRGGERYVNLVRMNKVAEGVVA